MDIGEQLHDLAEQVLGLIRATDELAQKRALRMKLTQILKETERLATINVRTDTKKYADATAALTEANQAVAAAIEDLARVAQTIEKVAEAIDLVVEVGKKAAGA
jgi:DNA-directed RNA polymerase subunit L